MPENSVRAIFDDKTIRVYQAYRADIALPALAAGRFVPPFKMDRMTWIKPSFGWMMYRSGYASKPGQEFVLGIDITRDGFEWALAHATLSSFKPSVHPSYEVWKADIESKPVRVQWDPERDWKLQPIRGVRAVQIGLSREAIKYYARDWIVKIEDVTPLVKKASQAIIMPPDLPSALERPYPLPADLAYICCD
ncbi:DUF4291 domain-containing protein [Allochromatium vinosum]|uniref:DUF4291 domain-containing protein n=1 Tax=Allochromatium vinosum (strain ATCC 17899 / DSM 180 / NBRC 103801 / NCIMB 10441 / D) TaxID=572477 RepID=D3RNX9_ALLVD|nr:DUF4291 domain-containing protein [Allochromatium vinosum]ADC61489.1 conserved hypothetical protein [Allochromatium vinosum DSM 180]